LDLFAIVGLICLSWGQIITATDRTCLLCFCQGHSSFCSLIRDRLPTKRQRHTPLHSCITCMRSAL